MGEGVENGMSTTDYMDLVSTGVSHYSGSLFGLFGFVPNNQNTVLAQYFQAFRDLSEPIPCSSMFLLLS